VNGGLKPRAIRLGAWRRYLFRSSDPPNIGAFARRAPVRNAGLRHCDARGLGSCNSRKRTVGSGSGAIRYLDPDGRRRCHRQAWDHHCLLRGL